MPTIHLSLERVRQEAAYFPHSLLNLCLCSILLQNAIDVGDGHLAHLAVATSLKASLVECSWEESEQKAVLLTPCGNRLLALQMHIEKKSYANTHTHTKRYRPKKKETCFH